MLSHLTLPAHLHRLAAKFEGVLVDGERAVGLNPNIRIYR